MSDGPHPPPVPPLHEREEYIAMRDRMAEGLLRELSIDKDRAWELANKLTPVCYLAVETRCVQWHLNAVNGANGMMLAIGRIEQLDGIRAATKTWAERLRLTVPEEMRTTSERALLAAYDKYIATRAKDN